MDPINNENYNLAKGYGLGKNKSPHFLHLTASPYEYCKDNPVKNIDPNGEQEVPIEEDTTPQQLQEHIVYGEKKRSFWEKAGAFVKGVAKAVVVTVAVVAVLAIVASTGPVGLIIAGVAGKILLGVGVASTVKTGIDLIRGRELFSNRKLGELEKWEMGGELAFGIVAGAKMIGGKKAPVSTKTPVASETPTSRWTSNSTETRVFSEPTNTGAGKFNESIKTIDYSLTEPVVPLPVPRRVGNLAGGPLENATQVSGRFPMQDGPVNDTL